MKTVKKSVLLWYSPQEMYLLVTAIDQYPQFLPWCDQARIVAADDLGVMAEVGISFSGIRQTFTTRNTHTPDQRVAMSLVKGPFSSLDGEWIFLPLAQDACKVLFTLKYAFSSRTLEALVGPIFNRIASSFIDSFTQRAQSVYGHN